MRTFIAKQFVFFLFASVISFIWSKWSFTKQQKKAIFLLRFSRRVEANARGSEERSGLFVRTAFFALLSLRAYASRFPPLAWKRQQWRLRHLTSKVSMVTVVLALPWHAGYPTNHAIEAFWKPSEAKVTQRTATSGASALWWMCSVEI